MALTIKDITGAFTTQIRLWAKSFNYKVEKDLKKLAHPLQVQTESGKKF